MTQINKTEELYLTPAITGTYGALDVVGGLLQFTAGAGASPGGTVRSFNLADDAAGTNVYTLYLFRQRPTTIADNAPYAVTSADDATRMGKITIAAGDYESHNSNTHVVKNSDIDFTFTGTVIYGYLVCTGTPTLTAGTLKLCLTVWKD